MNIWNIENENVNINTLDCVITTKSTTTTASTMTALIEPQPHLCVLLAHKKSCEHAFK